MDLLLILRDALASSVIGGLSLALEAAKAGQQVGVLFTEEALAAIARGTFQWPRELAGQEMRLLMADRGAEMGLPLLARGEGRQLDAKGMLSKAQEAGVVLYACPIWTSLLGLTGDLPHGLQRVEAGALPALIRSAKRVIGTL